MTHHAIGILLLIALLSISLAMLPTLIEMFRDSAMTDGRWKCWSLVIPTSIAWAMLIVVEVVSIFSL